jgi:plasmid maintenance system antidote protein VapI
MDDQLTKKVRAWASQEAIRPKDFAKKTGYSYQHAYNLLKGKGLVSDETMGRISRTYGPSAVSEIMALEPA